MIINMQTLNLAEVKELAKGAEENKDFKDYLKKFGKLSKSDGEKLRKDLEALDNMKMKEEYYAKVADFLPKDAEDLNKIFSDVSLDEKETNEILEIVKKY